MITDEQVKLVANTYIGTPISNSIPSENMTDMRRALEAYEKSKPKPEPFGYFRPDAFSWTNCEEEDDGAVALYELKDVL